MSGELKPDEQRPAPRPIHLPEWEDEEVSIPDYVPQSKSAGGLILDVPTPELNQPQAGEREPSHLERDATSWAVAAPISGAVGLLVAIWLTGFVESYLYHPHPGSLGPIFDPCFTALGLLFAIPFTLCAWVAGSVGLRYRHGSYRAAVRGWLGLTAILCATAASIVLLHLFFIP